MEKYSQYRDRGEHAVAFGVIVSLITLRLWYRPFLPYFNAIFCDLSAFLRIFVPNTTANSALSHFELFLSPAVVTYWISGKEGFIMANTWHTGRLVD